MPFNWGDIFFDSKLLKLGSKPLIKKLIAGTSTPFVMRPGEVILPGNLKRLGLYLHVPFCNSLCPYCPYNRVKYEEDRYRRFEAAAHQEIDIYAQKLRTAFNGSSKNPPAIVSLYIGGGTPTIEPHGLARLIDHINEAFGIPNDICVELHPAAMNDACLDILKASGVTMLSIGVESLCDRLLRLIGRSHDRAIAYDAVKRAVARGFDSVNTDLLFALPTQTLSELDSDISEVLSLGVDQISTYPLFGFPYSEMGKAKGLDRITRPPEEFIRQILALARQRAHEYNLEQCAVWSFLRPKAKKFSSITRHHYIGIGPSAASMTGGQFYVNTFSVDAYAEILPDKLPVALVLPMNKRLEMAFWLYWRLYEMKASKADFLDLFGEDLDPMYGWLFSILGLLGMSVENDGCYYVTDKAAYWIHRIQNEYSLNYIDHLWGACRAVAWPQRVQL